jgi:membrane protein
MNVFKQLWILASKTVERWNRNDGNVLAASMAYYAAFSFFPLVWVLMSVLGFFLRFSASVQGQREQFLEFVSRSTSPALADQVGKFLTVVEEGAPVNTASSIVVFLIGAIGVFSQLEAAFGRLWHAVTPAERGVLAAIRNALWNRLKAFLTLLGLGIVMLVVLVAQFLLAGARTWAEDEHLHWTISLWPSVQYAMAILLNTVVLALLFKMIPRVTVLWRHAFVGGLTVAVVWQVGAAILSRFFIGGHYSAYGVVGSFIVIMLWVYCASTLLLLGAQLVQVLGHPEENTLEPAISTPTRGADGDGILLGVGKSESGHQANSPPA